MSEWLYEDKLFELKDDDPYVGFVYLITNLQTGKKYYGKKNFGVRRKVRYKPSKKTGKTRRPRLSVKQSDWQSYYGSNEYLQKDVELLGVEHFKREIVRLCTLKGEMSYYEMKFQIENDVLLKPDEYYNSFVGGKIHRKHVLRT